MVSANYSRLSNIELLRVFAMILILLVHTGFKTIHAPSNEEIVGMPISSFMRFFIQSLSVVGVNLFVLTSGWFGINVKLKKFTSFLFQILFFVIIGYVIGFSLFSIEISSLKQLCLDLWFNSSYWFIRAYIVLYFFSPVLNAFVNSCDSRQLLRVILFFYLCQFLFGWYFDSVKWYANGYSPLSFMGLYLLARYLKLYLNNKFITRWHYLGVYVMLSLCIAIVCMFSKLSSQQLLTYNSPFVILSSVSLFLFFANSDIHSDIINNIAKSCFAVYLLHCHPILFDNVYCRLLKNVFDHNTYSYYIIYSLGIVFLFFIIAVLIDRIRILLWDSIILKIIITDERSS